MLGHEIADTNGAYLAIGKEVLKGAIGIQGFVERGRQGLVQDQQIELLNAQFLGALFETVQGLVKAVIVDPNLGLDEDLIARNARAANALAHFTFIAIGGCGIDVTITDAQGFLHGIGCLVRRGLKHAKTDCRYLDTVVEL